MSSVRSPAARAVSGLLLALAVLAAPAAALAQPAEPSRPGLSAGAPRIQVSLAPGAAAQGEVLFPYSDSGAEPIVAHASVVEYRVTPEGESLQPPSERGPGRWISLEPATQEIRPGASGLVRYRVEVPLGVAPGDYTALIVLEPESGASRAAVRLVVNVPGEAVRQAELVSFGAQREPLRLFLLELPNSAPLYDGGPIQLRAQVRNAGSVQLSTSGVIRVVDLFGNEQRVFELPPEVIYPGDTRTLSEQWTYVPPVGWFTTRLSLDAGGVPIVAEERLLVVPWQALLGALLLIGFLRLVLGRAMALPVTTSGEATAPVAVAASASPHPYPLAGGEGEHPLPLREGRGEGSAAEGVVLEGAAAGANGQGEPGDVLELLRLGQEAARTGDREAAHGYFVGALKLDPENEEAWLWRAGTAEHPREAMRSLEQVLIINPNNLRARRGLEELQRRFVRT